MTGTTRPIPPGPGRVRRTLGVSPRAYQNYERGEREVPAVVLKALYEVYGADPLWVLTGLSLDSAQTTASDLDVLEEVVIALETRLKGPSRATAREEGTIDQADVPVLPGQATRRP